MASTVETSSMDTSGRRPSAASYAKRKRSLSTMVKSVMKSDRSGNAKEDLQPRHSTSHRKESVRGLRGKFKGLFQNSRDEENLDDASFDDWPKSKLRLSRSMPNILDIDDLKNVNSFEELEALEIYKEQKMQALQEIKNQQEEAAQNAKEQKQVLEQKSSWPAQKSRSLLSDLYFEEGQSIHHHDRKRSTSLLLRKLSSNSFTGIEEEPEEYLDNENQDSNNNIKKTNRASMIMQPTLEESISRTTDEDDEDEEKPDIKCTDELIRQIASEELHAKLDDKSFQADVMSNYCREISENIQERIKRETRSTKKIVVKVFAAAFLDRGVHVAVNCIHDTRTDNYVTISLLGSDWHAWASILAIDV